MTVLVTAASEHGATGELATAIADALRRRGLDVVVMPPDDVRSIEEFGAVALGSAVYSGHWLKPATDLVEGSRRRTRRAPGVAVPERPRRGSRSQVGAEDEQWASAIAGGRIAAMSTGSALQAEEP